MNTRFIFNRFRLSSGTHLSCLIALWVVGLLFGIFLYVRFFQASGLALACLLFSEGRKLVFLTAGVPIAVTAFSIYSGCYLFCYPLFLTEAIARGFCSVVIFGLAGSAGWLLRGILLFTGIWTSVTMWWLLLRSRHATVAGVIRTVVINTGFICAVNFFVVSPFASGLSIYF